MESGGEVLSADLAIGTPGTPEKEWRQPFLDALAECGSVRQAAKHANVGRTTVYRERLDDPAFARMWDVAKKLGIDALEDACIERGFNGSDTLLIFRLKAELPKYRDKQPTGLNFTLEELQSMTLEQLDDLAAKLTRLG